MCTWPISEQVSSSICSVVAKCVLSLSKSLWEGIVEYGKD